MGQKDLSMQAPNATLHLVSSLDETAGQIAASLPPRARLLVVETARLGEGRSFAPGDAAPFQEYGMQTRLCDLRCETPASLALHLDASDGCVLLGGNTFVLMEALAQIGYADVIAARARADDFQVIGESAGAVVMGSSIAHVADMDDPSAAGTRHDAGLGWIDARVLPHRGCPHWGFGEAVDRIIAADSDPGSLLVLDEDELLTLAPEART